MRLPLLLALSAALWLPTAVYAGPAAPPQAAAAAKPAPAASAKSSAELFKNLMTLVSSEFIYEEPPGKLVNGAIEGLKNALKAKKLAPLELAKVPESASREDAVKQFSTAYFEVAGKYPELLKDNWLAFEAIKGMLKSLGDQYTVFMTPDEYGNLKDSMSGGNFGGLGIYIQIDKSNDGMLTVVEPIEDTPAFRAGVKPGDVILKINGKTTRNITIEGAQALLRGEVGSKVTLTIRRKNQAQPFDMVVARERIHVSSVAHKLVDNAGKKIGYLKLRVFGDKTGDEMESAIRDLERQGAEAYILDLRNNGGGYIQASVDVCSKFLPTGSHVVSVEERGEGTNNEYLSHPSLRGRKPLLLLVNEYSASASEITAGAMKDLSRARLVGVKTFGKGSVQKIFPLPDGSALKVTTAHYHTPSGHDLNKVGVEPDLKVQMPGDKLGTTEDAQFKAALQAVSDEVAALPAQPAPDTTMTTVDDEVRYLDAQKAQGFEIVSKQLKREQDGLFEDVVLRKAGQDKTVRLDLSSFLRH